MEKIALCKKTFKMSLTHFFLRTLQIGKLIENRKKKFFGYNFFEKSEILENFKIKIVFFYFFFVNFFQGKVIFDPF